MKGRGQGSFIRLPAFAAGLYDHLMHSKAIELQYREIAEDLASRAGDGRLLDVGTGPGRLLFHLHRLNKDLKLYGLDISPAMVERASKNLAAIPADLRLGNIEHTDYPDASFEIITCSGSLYLWDHPVACLNEIHRLLRPGGSAWLYESYRDYDREELRTALRSNLEKEGLLRRLITPHFLKRQLRMTYERGEFCRIIDQSLFRKAYALERLTLGGLPVWLRIRLSKPVA